MSADASVTIQWADGEYKFRTGLGEWREIQTKCDAGLVEILDRLRERKWRVEDIREPIRIALIGGGTPPVEALRLVKRYVDERPLEESRLIALLVLLKAVVGVEDDQPGKRGAEGVPGMGASPSRPSTETA